MTVEKMFQELSIGEREIVVLKIALNEVVDQYESMKKKTKIAKGMIDILAEDDKDDFQAFDGKGKKLTLDDCISGMEKSYKEFEKEFGLPAKNLIDKFQPIFKMIEDAQGE